MIVVDASVGLLALLDAGPARRALSEEQVHVPHLVDSEVASGLRRMAGAGEVDAAAARMALDRWGHLGLTRYAVTGLLGRVWELRANLSAYDACYVALAEELGCALLTADRRIGRAPGPRCLVTVVPR